MAGKELLTHKKEGEIIEVSDITNEIGRTANNLHELNFVTFRGEDGSYESSGKVFQGDLPYGHLNAFIPAKTWEKPHGLSTEQVSVILQTDRRKLAENGLSLSDIAEDNLSNEKLGSGMMIGPEIECNIDSVININQNRAPDENVRNFRLKDQVEVHANDLELALPPSKNISELISSINKNVSELVLDGYQNDVVVSLGGTRSGFYDPRETEISSNGTYNNWIAQKLSGLTREAVPWLDDVSYQNLHNLSVKTGFSGLDEFVSGNKFQQWDIAAGHFSIDIMAFEGYTIPEEEINLTNAATYFAHLIKASAYSGGRIGGYQFEIEGKPVASAREIAKHISSTAAPSLPPLSQEQLKLNQQLGVVEGFAPIPDRTATTTIQNHYGGHSDVRLRNTINFDKYRKLEPDFTERKAQRLEFTGLDAAYAKLNDYYRAVSLMNTVILANRFAMAEGYWNNGKGDFFQWMTDNGVGNNMGNKLYKYATSNDPLEQRNRLLVGEPNQIDSEKLNELKSIVSMTEFRMQERVTEGKNPDFDMSVFEYAKAGIEGIENDWLFSETVDKIGAENALISLYPNTSKLDLNWYADLINDKSSISMGRLLSHLPLSAKEMIVSEAYHGMGLERRIPNKENVSKMLKNYPKAKVSLDEAYHGELDLELGQIAALISTKTI